MERAMITKFSAKVMLLLLASCLQAHALVLEVDQGVVKLSRGKGFKPIKGNVVVKVGDTVKVDENAKAKLVALDGSCVYLQPGVKKVFDPSASEQVPGKRRIIKKDAPADCVDPSEKTVNLYEFTEGMSGSGGGLGGIGAIGAVGALVGGGIAAAVLTSGSQDNIDPLAALAIANALKPTPVSQ